MKRLRLKGTATICVHYIVFFNYFQLLCIRVKGFLQPVHSYKQ